MRKTWVLASLVALFGASGSLFALPNYAIVEIPPLGGMNSHAWAVGTANQVVGDGDLLDGTNVPLYFVYNSHQIPVAGARFYSVNIDGQCVGVDGNVAILYDQVFGLLNLPVGPSGSFGSVAMQISDRGSVVGSYEDRLSDSSPVRMHVYRWDAINGSETVADDAQGWAINMDGAVACTGWFHNPNIAVGQMFVVEPDNSIFYPQIPGNMEGEQPTGISTIGPRICGTAYTIDPSGAPDALKRAFLYDENAIWRLLLDPADPSLETEALGTNFWGDYVVGYSIPSPNHGRAIVWEVDPTNPFTPVTATDLNTVLPPNSNWELFEATGVNSYHSICGWGFRYINGQYVQRGFLLIPQNLVSIYADPPSAISGNDRFGTIATDVASSVDTTLNLSASPFIAVPDTVAIPAGTKLVTFLIRAKPVSTTSTGTITVSLGKAQKSMSFTVYPASPIGLELSADAVKGGASLTGTFSYNGTVPTNTTISLSSSDSHVVVPSSVVVHPNQSGATFKITTSTPPATITATVTATVGGTPYTATLTVTP